MNETIVMDDLPTSDSLVSDQDLLSMARDGDLQSAIELWRRHSAYGLAVAEGLAPEEDWEAMSARAWKHILHPSNLEEALDGFRPYLYLVIRAVSSLEEVTKDSFLTSAYQNLPDQWREVLWYAHVESMRPAQISVFIGLGPAEVPRLLHRAREGLRQEWAHLHAEAVPEGSLCREIWESSASSTHNVLADQSTAWMDIHIRTCRTCKSARSDAISVASHLPKILLPTVAGSKGGANLLAYLRTNGPCVRAVTDLPEKVSELFSPASDGTGVPRTTASAWIDSHEPRSRPASGRLKLGPLVLGVLLLVVLVTAIIAATRPHDGPVPDPALQPASGQEEPMPDATKIVTVDTGPLNNLNPIASGTTQPRAVVEVHLGASTVRITADEDGAWTTAGSVIEFTSIRGIVTASTDQDPEPAATTYEMALPPTIQSVSGASLALTGMGGATVEVLVDGESASTVNLDSTGHGMGTLSLPKGTHFVQVRYCDQSRFGPSSAALAVTVP